MTDYPKLQAGRYYHIFNRGNNREDLFREERNYAYFLKLYVRHVEPVADTFAYCLMRNHFHLLVRIKDLGGDARDLSGLGDLNRSGQLDPAQQFSNLFNSYTKAINKAYGRTGSLFQRRFGRIEVDSERYFLHLVRYIHQNPQRHGFVEDFRDYPHSSYGAVLASKPTRLRRTDVLEAFGGRHHLEAAHRTLIGDDDVGEVIHADFEQKVAVR